MTDSFWTLHTLDGKAVVINLATVLAFWEGPDETTLLEFDWGHKVTVREQVDVLMKLMDATRVDGGTA